MKRHHFIPEKIWVSTDDGWMAPLQRSEDPEMWQRICDSDESVVTQVDEGKNDDDRGIFPTSSSSAPSLVREMIDLLAVEPGMTIFEIGTGTGYNAALLAEIVGAENVTTIDVDPMVTDHARKALRSAGLPVVVITGDGMVGYPDNAPYDRVISTAAVQRISYEWVTQSREHGRVLVPWSSAFDPGGALLNLDVTEAGTAEGRFGRRVSFMYLREHRPIAVGWVEDDQNGDYTQSTTHFYPSELFEIGSDARFAMGVKLPGFLRGKTIDEEGVYTLRLSHHETKSWASCTPGTDNHIVRQHGPRRLWDELEFAYQWWIDAGKPDSTRFGMTVTKESKMVWLDSPGKIVSP